MSLLSGRGAPHVPQPQLPHLPACLTLCVGVALSLLLSSVARQDEQERARRAFEHAAERRAHEIQQRVELSTLALRVTKAFYAGSMSVERDEFRDFTAPLLLDGTRLPST